MTRSCGRAWLLVVCAACDCGDGGPTVDAGPPDAPPISDGSPGDVPVADAGIDAGSDAGADGGVDAAGGDGDGGATEDCAGRPDFTPCRVVTSPDREYDICVGGTCVSPGCGDASCTPPGPNFALADTGQRRCYSTVATTACAGAACVSLCGQDAEHGWDATHPMASRYARSEPIVGEPVIEDRVTGLAWQGCSRGLSGTSCEIGAVAETLWADALAYCDALTWGGFDDWRLPDVLEGHSIMDYGQPVAVTDSTFPNTPMLRHFTSTSWAGAEDAVWIAPFSGADGKLGVIVGTMISLSSGAVRCVRTNVPFIYPASPRERDTSVPGEPVVVDRVTGRSFQGCTRGQAGSDCAEGADAPASWAEALSYCDTLTWGGFDDWRLPDVKELRSSIDSSRTAPGLDPALYPNAPAFPAWTATTDAANATQAWSVTVGFGGGIQEGGKAGMLTVRCVR